MRVSYDGNALSSTQQVQDLVKRHAKDAPAIALIVNRDGQLLQVAVVPGRLGVTMRVQRQAAR